MLKEFYRLISTLFLVTFILTGASAQNFSTASFNEIKALANSGNVKAIYQLGKIYEEGIIVKGNVKKAFKYYGEAAKHDYDSALFAIGRFYELGLGTSQNYKMAVNYYQGAAAKKHAEANFKLGQIYETGNGGVQKDIKQSVNYYLKALELNYAPAQEKLEKLPVDENANKSTLGYTIYKAGKKDPEYQYKLGKLYETGQGVEKNEALAFRNYFEAANAGNGKAQYELGKIYKVGNKTKDLDVPRNIRLAVLNFVKAANNGVPEAKKELDNVKVELYLDQNNPDYLVYKANKNGGGNTDKKFELYKKYFYGVGVPKDQEKGLEYCQMAALEGNEQAMLTLANMYQKGIYVKPSLENAFQWYREAAFLKNDTAIFALASMYEEGLGTKVNSEKAVRWYLRAAASENGELAVRAMYKLGRYEILKYIDPNDLDYISYIAQKGDTNAQMRIASYYFSKNDNKAVYWYTKAAEAGVIEAMNKLGDIYLEGKCNVINDNRQAMQWYYKAASQNDIHAMKQLAYMFSQNLIPEERNSYELGTQLAQKYLEVTKSNPGSRDLIIYKVIGDLSLANGEFKNAIPYYTTFIKGYDPQMNKPLEVIKAVNSRGIAYYNLKDYNSASTDLGICLLVLEEYKDHPDVKPQYAQSRGLFYYQEGRITFDMGNILKACNSFQMAKNFGVETEPKYQQACLNR
ncbi:SEL1-like repeat protein [Flexithrix dorotheae]|uniref:SEL1-like repeat protein n=1 Tax=Flexithrix dorotheae TaxID=70993 RepID=UPI00037413C1|nr:tetratricopeptide repeat protein [Flexithrix dorotheae]